ncbi:jg4464 [Pararge aegeria aegeria]|uniref:Jg4464 protein n=1 Tax=Pararge aegeria aegeria TaxID=348720 RepID=A0A8S4QYT9_9NEOP|nr:jg4464 [Pararge aegeria aegeria]
MSIKVENNLKERKDDKIFEQKAHYIPCQVEEDGPANVSEYFEPYVVDNGNGGKKYINLINAILCPPHLWEYDVRPMTEEVQREGSNSKFIYFK